MHWFGLSELEWVAIIIVVLAAIIIERLTRICVVLDGVHKIMWLHTGGPDRR